MKHTLFSLYVLESLKIIFVHNNLQYIGMQISLRAIISPIVWLKGNTKALVYPVTTRTPAHPYVSQASGLFTLASRPSIDETIKLTLKKGKTPETGSCGTHAYCTAGRGSLAGIDKTIRPEKFNGPSFARSNWWSYAVDKCQMHGVNRG